MVTNLLGEVNDIYPAVVQRLLAEGRSTPSRVSDTVELHPVVLEIEDPRRRLVTSYGRPVNVAFALAEVMWILAGRRDVAFLAPYNQRIKDYSDDGTNFNAAYGFRLRHQHNIDQIQQAVEGLKRDQGSRQITLTITHPVSDRQGHFNKYGGWTKHNTSDRACNLLSHLLVRNGKLDWLQVVRSNDAVWGAPYNWMQFSHLQEYIANSIGVSVGSLYWVVDSLHIYDYHQEEAAAIQPFNLYEELQWHHDSIEAPHLPQLVRMTDDVSKWGPMVTTFRWPTYWANVGRLLYSYRLFKSAEDYKSLSLLLDLGDPVYNAAQARFCFHARWHRPGYEPLLKEILGRWGGRVAEWILTAPVEAQPKVV